MLTRKQPQPLFVRIISDCEEHHQPCVVALVLQILFYNISLNSALVAAAYYLLDRKILLRHFRFVFVLCYESLSCRL
ncbi:hypothetical protein ACHQM5_026986 [Ranunculus cassubicifolius]